MNTNPNIAIYIHWPWCKKKCPYCDFNSHVSDHLPEEEYLACLLQDFKYQSQDLTHKNLVSIFFGGGTPSLMKASTAEKLINTACTAFNTTPEAVEITLEANPTSSSLNKFKEFTCAGVNRFSIGVQSLQDKHLRFLGREHTAQDALKTVEAALKTDARINFDLIYGLPEQELSEWQKDLSYAVSVGTGHISAYQLTIEPNTKFYADMRKNKLQEMPADKQADFYEATRELLLKHGYNHYEISNFAKTGQNCAHNTHVWQYGTYLGIGAGAHGRVYSKNVTAKNNYKLPQRYIERVQENSHGIFSAQELDDETILFERILLGIRLSDGVQLTQDEFKALNSEWTNKLCDLRILNWDGETLKVSPQHTQMTDDILLKILK